MAANALAPDVNLHLQQTAEHVFSSLQRSKVATEALEKLKDELERDAATLQKSSRTLAMINYRLRLSLAMASSRE